jgi:dihydrofolate reductase
MAIKCSVFIATSLDGYIARKDGAIDWLVGSGGGEGGEDFGYGEFISGIDTLVMGRNTYELALSFRQWPYAGKKVVVVSRRSPIIPERLADNVSLTSLAPPDLLLQLWEQGARHVYVDGGRTIQGFLSVGLIHEMTITRIPLLIGEGIPLFDNMGHDIKLQHIATKTYGNGFVQSRYRVMGAVA